MVNKAKAIVFAVGLGLALALGLFSLLLPQRPGYAAAGNVFCVVPPGESTGPFAACDQVFTSVQAAVDAAAGGEEIRVATGVYTDLHERNGSFQVVYVDKSLAIGGGYTIPFSDPPDPAGPVTILDAQDAGRVLFVTGQVSVTIEGLHLTGGWVHQTTVAEPGLGGGLYVDGATILLQDNVIAANRVVAGYSDQAAYGGGVYLTAAHATLRDNLIHDNLGYDRSSGGGVAARQSTVVLENNTIISNTAGEQIAKSGPVGFLGALGGGVYLEESQVTFAANDVSHNTALQAEESGYQHNYSYGGGLALVNSSGNIISNTISNNLAADWGNSYGGGVYIEGSGSLTLAQNVIQGNVASANGQGNGGGIVVLAQSEQAPSITLHENQIVSNTAVISGPHGIGGGMALFYGPFQGSSPLVTLTHNSVISNTAVVSGELGIGGGLAAGSAQLYLEQNVLAENVAAHSSANGHGGGLYLAENQAHLTRNIIRNNHTTTTGGGLVLEGGHTVIDSTAIIDNQGSQAGGGLHLICGAYLEATHLTISRNEGHGIHLARLGLGCNVDDPLPNTAILTNTILASHDVGAAAAANTGLALHGVLWHDTPIFFQAEPGAQVTISDQHFGNPLFAADGYHITAASAARFRGVPGEVAFDIDGQARPLANPSLGADEYWLATYFFPVVRRGP